MKVLLVPLFKRVAVSGARELEEWLLSRAVMFNGHTISYSRIKL